MSTEENTERCEGACGGQGDPFPHELDGTECVEDDPCWDCSTMGNGLCGVVVERGDSFVVPDVEVPTDHVMLPATGIDLTGGLAIAAAVLVSTGFGLLRAARR